MLKDTLIAAAKKHAEAEIDLHKANIEVYMQSRDLLDRQIDVDVGDFFTYGTVIFEITSVSAMV